MRLTTPIFHFIIHQMDCRYHPEQHRPNPKTTSVYIPGSLRIPAPVYHSLISICRQARIHAIYSFHNPQRPIPLPFCNDIRLFCFLYNGNILGKTGKRKIRIGHTSFLPLHMQLPSLPFMIRITKMAVNTIMIINIGKILT